PRMRMGLSGEDDGVVGVLAGVVGAGDVAGGGGVLEPDEDAGDGLAVVRVSGGRGDDEPGESDHAHPAGSVQPVGASVGVLDDRDQDELFAGGVEQGGLAVRAPLDDLVYGLPGGDAAVDPLAGGAGVLARLDV